MFGLVRSLMKIRRDVADIRLAAMQAAERQQRVLELVERLSEFNARIWDHHLLFCGQLTEKVATAENEVLLLGSSMVDELDTLRRAVQGVVQGVGEKGAD